MLRRTVLNCGLSPLLSKKTQRSGVLGRKLPVDGHPIYSRKEFHVGIDGIATEIHRKFGRCNHLFVRSSIGSGKSTFAYLLRAANPKRVWMIAKWNEDISFLANLQQATNGAGQSLGAVHNKHTNATALLIAIKKDMLIIDECHLMFVCEGESGFQELFKGEATPHILLLSSSGAATKAAKNRNVQSIPTPAIIKNKEFIDFSLSFEDVSQLLRRLLETAASQVNVQSYDRLAHILFRYHQGHKLFTMQAIEALCNAIVSETFVTETAAMQASVSTNVTQCRAAVVNNDFEESPGCLRAAALLLGQGYLEPHSLSPSVGIGSLLVRGAVVPLEQHSSAKAMLTAPENDYGRLNPPHVSSNPFAVRDMMNKLKLKAPHTLPVVGEIGGAEDIVLLGIAYLDYTFGDNAFLRTTQLASELTNQMAFAKAFTHAGKRFEHSRELSFYQGAWAADQKYITYGNNKRIAGGIIDHRIVDKNTNKKYFVEMLERGDLILPAKVNASDKQNDVIKNFETTVRTHVERFYNSGKTTYEEALNSSDGVALTVYTPSSSVEEALKEVQESFEAAVKAIKNAEKMKQFLTKMTGVVLEELSCWEYNVFIIKHVDDEWREFRLGRVLSDCVARRFVLSPPTSGGAHIAVNQRCPTDLEVCRSLNRPVAVNSLAQSKLFATEELWSGDKPEEIVPALSLWVCKKQGNECIAFEVFPAENTIDSLKKAIKAETSIIHDAGTINIFEWDFETNTAKADAVVTPTTPLQANTVDTPYNFTAPPKTVWVSLKPEGKPFKVAPLGIDIDSLKKAIKPSWEPVEQAQITIIDPDTQNPVEDPDLVLKPNSAKTAYLFELPSN